MIGRMKATVVGWLVGRHMRSLMKVSELDRQAKRDIVETVVQTVKNMVQGKHTIKTEPVLFGGVVTIAVALFLVINPRLRMLSALGPVLRCRRAPPS